MKKLRSDALWNSYTPEQQKKIEQWLFDEHLSYRDTCRRMNAEFGLRCAASTLCGVYRRLQEVRDGDPCHRILDFARLASPEGIDMEQLRAAETNMMISQLCETIMRTKNVKDMAELARLVMRLRKDEPRKKRSKRPVWLRRKRSAMLDKLLRDALRCSA